jgi:TolB protein
MTGPAEDRRHPCEWKEQQMAHRLIGRLTLVAVLVAILMPSSGAVAQSEAASPAAATPPASPFAGDPAWIAYYGRDGIGLIHPDGTGDRIIDTGVPGESLLANWSPDGRKLVFTTRGGETEPLYEYDLATGTSRQLFACEDPCVGDDEPVYSPDGTKVLFSRALAPFVQDDHQGGEVPSDCGLWIGDVATGEVTQLTSNTDPPCDREYSPRFSPDGTQITYWRDPYSDGKPTGTSVWVMNADGTDARQLTDPVMQAGNPDWSPDGDWLVFSTWPLLEYQCCQVSNLYRMHPDGSGMEQLTFNTDDSLRATQPLYTPDGQWIIFTSVTPEDRNIGIMPAEGGEPMLLTHGGIYTHNTWQPNASVPVATPMS